MGRAVRERKHTAYSIFLTGSLIVSSVSNLPGILVPVWWLGLFLAEGQFLVAAFAKNC